MEIKNSLFEFTKEHTLTIYVLAYCNAECVLNLLSSLLPLQTNDVCVVIADNSEDQTVYRQIFPMFDQFKSCLYYHRHEVNIGAVANIMRSFETISSQYLWIVGACNNFKPAALETLLPILKTEKPEILLHREDNLFRRRIIEKKQVYHCPLDLINEHSYSVFCSVNSLIYSISAIRNLVPAGYFSMTSMVPHTAMVLKGMFEKKLKVTYYPLEIFHRHIRTPQWSIETFLTNIAAVLPEPEQWRNRKKFLSTCLNSDPWIFQVAREKPRLIYSLVFTFGSVFLIKYASSYFKCWIVRVKKTVVTYARKLKKLKARIF